MCYGTFNEPNTAGFIAHSGLFCIDIDKLTLSEMERLEGQLRQDPFVFALHRSLSGFGLCVWVKASKVTADNTQWGFQCCCDYFAQKHDCEPDESVGNIARRRAWSYDPQLYQNPQAQAFKFPPQPKKEVREIKVAFTDSDFNNVLKQVSDRRLNLVGTYSEWVQMGFALADGLGEGGRQAFHLLSSIDSGNYHYAKADRKYDSCLRNTGGRKITIGTFFHRCKQEGIEITSQRTKLVTEIVRQGKKQGHTIQTIKANMPPADSNPEEEIKLIEQAFQMPVAIDSGLDIDSQVELFLKANYIIQFNSVRNQLEVDGQAITDRIFNSIWLRVRKEVSDKYTDSVLRAMLNSDRFPEADPIADYLNSLPDWDLDGPSSTYQLAQCFGPTDQTTLDYTHYFLTKWGVGFIYQALAVEGMENSLCLVFHGPQNTGKTSIARSIIPKALHRYRKESEHGTKEVDEAIEICDNVLIIDDEGVASTKKEAAKQKGRLSKSTVAVRASYARFTQARKRRASFIVTTNETDFINDHTGNRRLIPIEVNRPNWQLFNSLNPEHLIREWMTLYRDGHDFRLSTEDIARLNVVDSAHRAVSQEEEMIAAALEFSHHGEWLSTTQIYTWLVAESGNTLRITTNLLGKYLTKAAVKAGVPKRGNKYGVKRISGEVYKAISPNSAGIKPLDAPF